MSGEQAQPQKDEENKTFKVELLNWINRWKELNIKKNQYKKAKKINDRYKPTFARTSRTTEDSNHQAQSQTLSGQEND